MSIRNIPVLATTPVLGACSVAGTGGQNSPQENPLPESIIEIAAPDQDLATAFLRPEDNCYWYQHIGPVETTLLPLRTISGNPICVQVAS